MISHRITKTRKGKGEGGWERKWEQHHVCTKQGEEDSKMIKVGAQALRDECSAMAKEAGRYVWEECDWVYVVIITVYQIQ